MGEAEARAGIRPCHAHSPMRAIVPAMPEPKPAFPELVEVVVEIPRRSRNPYEFDTRAGAHRLDRATWERETASAAALP
jgi:hypothetical protein